MATKYPADYTGTQRMSPAERAHFATGARSEWDTRKHGPDPLWGFEPAMGTVAERLDIISRRYKQRPRQGRGDRRLPPLTAVEITTLRNGGFPI